MSEETKEWDHVNIPNIEEWVDTMDIKHTKEKLVKIVVRLLYEEEKEVPTPIVAETKEGEIVVNFEMADETQAFGLETLFLTAKEGKHKLSSIVDYDSMVRLIVTELGSKYGSPVEVKAKDHQTAMDIEQLLSWVSTEVAVILEIHKYGTRVEVKYTRKKYVPPPPPEPKKIASKGWKFLRPGAE